MNRLDDVRGWRDRLRTIVLIGTGLSPAGARAAVDAALDALDDASLATALAMPGEPFRTATFVAASTVVSAPIEWLAVLLGRGTAVTMKFPAESPGLAPIFEATAREVDLPLTITSDRRLDGELVVAMGNDSTIAEIRASLPPATRFLGFGHRFSVAWVERDFASVAEDAAMHDGRGCFSPVAVFTPLPLAEACDALAVAMADAEVRWPIGEICASEAAEIRTRRALARVTGVVREGPGWSVHGLPIERFVPVASPRSLAVYSVTSEAAAEAVAPWASALSTVGTDGDPKPWDKLASRLCALGRMQRPPLLRRHDGVDWLQATLA